ncbi:hypothetical protein TIFTF001_015930 [Ficus carica]|uniref:Uncharacterized protein n=1 Tax=Ficus carica TaxID=3494 RepID=A0AA88D9E7_FICCA|nr:hypothetical protein TIFTF001_015930 [Ficus carica]
MSSNTWGNTKTQSWNYNGQSIIMPGAKSLERRRIQKRRLKIQQPHSSTSAKPNPSDHKVTSTSGSFAVELRVPSLARARNSRDGKAPPSDSDPKKENEAESHTRRMNVFAELKKIDGLTQEQVLRAGQILVESHDKTNFFYTLDDEYKLGKAMVPLVQGACNVSVVGGGCPNPKACGMTICTPCYRGIGRVTAYCCPPSIGGIPKLCVCEFTDGAPCPPPCPNLPAGATTLTDEIHV